MVYDAKREETFPIAGDGDPTGSGMINQSTSYRDPTGSGLVGASSGVELEKSKTATVVIRYKDRLIEADVYKFPDAPLKVVLICPRCQHVLNVDSTRKHIDLDLHEPRPVGDLVNMGRISIEPFECTWELPDAGVHTPGLQSGGMTLCRWKVGIDNNIAKDA